MCEEERRREGHRDGNGSSLYKAIQMSYGKGNSVVLQQTSYC